MAGEADPNFPQPADSARLRHRGEEHAETLVVEPETHRVVEGGGSPAEATSSMPGPPALPTEFGRYRIERLLGRGAMGAVFLARDTQLARLVALKVPSFGDVPPPGAVERFLREAHAAATLCHPNICPIHDVGEHSGIQFISMAYIEGRPLADYIASGKEQPEKYVAATVRKLALALHEAHQRGIIHRDLKPANVMIDRRNEPVVMDFGLARAIDDADESRLTREGTIVGTPAYMAPEQLTGSQRLGPATDVYALGVVLYELLAGQRPFGGSVVGVIGQILHTAPPRLEERRPGLSPEICEICRRAMAKQPSERFASMRDFAQALTDFLKGASGAAASSPLAASSTPAALVAPQPSATPSVAVSRRPANSKPAVAQRSKKRAADWWESGEALPEAPLPSGRAGSRRKRGKSAAPAGAWIGGGIILGAGILAWAVYAAFGTRGERQATANPPIATAEVAGPIATPAGEPRSSSSNAVASPATASAPVQDPPASSATAPEPAVPIGRPDEPVPVIPGRPDVPAFEPPATPTLPPPGAGSGIREMFASADRNRDGRLDRGEFPLHIILRADADGDLILTVDELERGERRMGHEALLAAPTPAEAMKLRQFQPRPGGRGGPGGPGQRGGGPQRPPPLDPGGGPRPPRNPGSPGGP